ncbi:MAG: restriction endonuclease [Bacteroidetes bacterium]|nr:restriction endonuclease [Bacteroidota bacterium]
MAKELSPSRALASKVIYEAFKILKAENGQLPGKEVIERIRNTVALTDWDKEVYVKTGYVRWESILHFFTIDCIKAGFMRKSKGIWYLTPEGEDAMKLGAVEMLNAATNLYWKWAAENKNKQAPVKEEDEIETKIEQTQKVNTDQLEEQAIDGIKQYIINKGAYEFQDLVAALLRAMGYYTPFVSPKGKDGGIDIIAYRDPLGIDTPRIKVQVKHYPESPISADAIPSLKGLINSGEEVGLFVTSGRFSNEAERFAREANVHIKLINGEELIGLWQEFYDKMNDEDKNLLPLHPIYFLGSNE